MAVTLPPHETLLPLVRAHRAAWRSAPRPKPEPKGPGEESVWDFPRPPAVEDVGSRITVSFAGEVVADTLRAIRVVETAGAPVYYLPPQDVAIDRLQLTDGVSVCEWKGAAVYYDLRVRGRISERAAFSYPDPLDDLGQGFSKIAGYFAFCAGAVDEARIDGEAATPQPGGLYAGWVTRSLKGPIKGAPGTEGW